MIGRITLDIIFFERGLLIGLIFGVPAGTIGALTIQRTLERGFMAGLITGLGSSAADLLYACVGVFGITLISNFLIAQQSIIRLAGGFLVIIIGITIVRKKFTQPAPDDSGNRPALYFLSSFSIAILNPATILSFFIAFTAFNIQGDLGLRQGIGLITGILISTIFWWMLISGIVSKFRNRVTDNIYLWLNRILGTLMIGFGIVMIFQGVRP